MFLVVAVGSGAAAQTAAPSGWEVTRVPDRPLTVVAPRGWKLSGRLSGSGAPSSVTFEGRGKGEPEGWLNVEALVSGGGTPEELLAKRPAGVTHVTTEDGWTCGEEAETGSEVVCARAGDLVTVVVELGGGSSKVVAKVGGVSALRRAAAQIQGVWPRGLPHPDPGGRLPGVEWASGAAQWKDGRVTWLTPKGWTPTDLATQSAEAPPSSMAFRASAGTGSMSITALPGVADATPAQLAATEERVIKLLLAAPSLTRTDGWTCGEGSERSSGLPAIICNRTTHDTSLYVSVRAEPAVLRSLGGVNSIRLAATRAHGFSY